MLVTFYFLYSYASHPSYTSLVSGVDPAQTGQMTKARLSMPGPVKWSFVSVEVLSMSSRRTLAGNTLNSATTANVTMIVPAGTAFELVGTVANLFNVQYADPASNQLLQDTISQNGRTWRVGLTWKLWSK